jgi:hypothetical protein
MHKKHSLHALNVKIAIFFLNFIKDFFFNVHKKIRTKLRSLYPETDAILCFKNRNDYLTVQYLMVIECFKTILTDFENLFVVHKI